MHICCRSSDADDLEFKLSELVEMKSGRKQSVKAGQQCGGRFGVGDTVAVVANRKTSAENKVSTLLL